jgi:hypothetical protein
VKGYENLVGEPQSDTRYEPLTAGSLRGENRIGEIIKGHDNREGDAHNDTRHGNLTAGVNERA